ncbi:ATP-binding protein [Actinomadura decatromicini]|uniref:ATP-binding protein n=1 Tax=Actinomadura decatromicini TaxID=2604572 RepID=A0A5D3FY88_9ACTN|nr:ATP-binding protein [Actinomadura decatromicini]TYK53301.1 ATP-binding protein [Actinomadura decatromicini]
MPAVLVAPESPALVLESSEYAPAKARRYLTQRFAELGLGDDFVGRVVVTELVTNAYKHVGVGRIIVRVLPDVGLDLTVIEVWDEGIAQPVVRSENDDAEDGRGLLLMAQLVHDWGVRRIGGEGKVVWARCAR